MPADRATTPWPTEPAGRAPRLAPRAVHADRRPPRRRRVRAGGDGGALDRRGLGRLAGLLHERRPGRRGSRRRSAGARRAARDASNVPRPRSSGYAGVSFLHQPDGALANDLALREHARPRDPDVPAGCGPRDRPRGALPSAMAASTTPTIARPASPRSTPSIRRRGIRWRSRRLRGSGLAAHVGPAAVPLLVQPARRLGRHLDDDRPQARRPGRASQPDPRSRGPGRPHPRVGGRGGPAASARRPRRRCASW